MIVQGDTSDAARAESLVGEAAEKLGGCDIFVHSAVPNLEKVYEHSPATEMPLEKWHLDIRSVEIYPTAVSSIL